MLGLSPHILASFPSSEPGNRSLAVLGQLASPVAMEMAKML